MCRPDIDYADNPDTKAVGMEALSRRTDGIVHMEPIRVEAELVEAEPLETSEPESHTLGLLALASDHLSTWMRGWGPAQVDADDEPPAPQLAACLAWHPQLQRIAVSTGSDSVRVFDLFEVDNGSNGFVVRPSPWHRGLRHDRQRGVSCIAWQPCRGTVLAVGCRGGVCVWGPSDEREVWRQSQNQITRHEAADAIWLERNHGSDQPFLLAPPGSAVHTTERGHSGDTAPGRTQPAAHGVSMCVRQFLNSTSRRAEAVNEADDMTAGRRRARVHTCSLAWSPDGQFLATCNKGDAAVLLWDVSTGHCTPLKVALDSVDRGYSLLRWSPDGRHLFAASTANRFRIWTAPQWTSAVWNTPACVQTAAWSPTSDVLLYTLRRGATVYSISIDSDAIADEFDPAAPAEARYPRALEPKDVIFFQNDTFAPKSCTSDREDANGGGGGGANVGGEQRAQEQRVEIVDLAWESWGGDRLAIVFRDGSRRPASSEVALYSITQDSRFGPPPRMSFALLGKVARQNADGRGARPLLASFVATPHSLRSLNRPGMNEHACLDALLGVLWTGGEDDDERRTPAGAATRGDGAAAPATALGAATVTWTPMIFRDPAAGASPSAAATLGRANAARHALALAGS